MVFRKLSLCRIKEQLDWQHFLSCSPVHKGRGPVMIRLLRLQRTVGRGRNMVDPSKGQLSSASDPVGVNIFDNRSFISQSLWFHVLPGFCWLRGQMPTEVEIAVVWKEPLCRLLGLEESWGWAPLDQCLVQLQWLPQLNCCAFSSRSILCHCTTQVDLNKENYIPTYY